MKLAIMQPTYLPWPGYFALMAAVDTFVFLDDVQYERRSWQMRNRILTAQGPLWLSVPLCHAPRETLLRDVEIHDAEDWRGRHLANVRHAYARHPFRDQLDDWLAPLADRAYTHLADLNIALIERATMRLGFAPRFLRSSALAVQGQRSDRLLAICRALNASVYHSPRGSADYIAEDGAFAAAGVPVQFQNYQVPAYPQRGATEFVTQLSLADALANLGWDGVREHLLGIREA